MTEGTTMFKKATMHERRLKALLWGESGVGKTILALSFPKPVIIDMEGGADLYGESFDFDVLKTNNVDEVSQAIEELRRNKHDYRTLIIDPITIFWDSLQKKWSDIYLERNPQSKGNKFDYFDFQPKDWANIKNEYKELLNDLISLDMNIVVTAREKVKYKDNGFMVTDGKTFDGEKNTDYVFDTVIRLYVTEDNKHMAMVKKDRSNKLPSDPFEINYKVFEDFIGKDVLNREAIPVTYTSKPQKAQIEKLVKELKIPEKDVTKALKTYGATCLHDLTKLNADVVIENLKKKKGE